MLRSLGLAMQFALHCRSQVICHLRKKNKQTKNRKENDAYVSMQGNDTHPPLFSSKQSFRVIV